MNPQILVDDRERNQDLLDTLFQSEGVGVEISRLETGDFEVDGLVLIERKTAADFVASLFDGRLFSQATRLVKSSHRGAYIVEGSAKDWASLRISREAIQGALISLMLIFDVPVLRSQGPVETAKLLTYAVRQLARARAEGDVPVRQVKAKRRSTRKQKVLYALPGIGSKRAKLLLAHFGSVRACLDADVDQLTKVDGVGRAIA
ncbi:MAG: ERCC4 domain-containing protein [Verrucomicrobiota bacterium]